MQSGKIESETTELFYTEPYIIKNYNFRIHVC